MRIEINIKKKHFYVLLALIVIFGAGTLVIAYGTSNPAVFGHSAGEIEGLQKYFVKGIPYTTATTVPANTFSSYMVVQADADVYIKDCGATGCANWVYVIYKKDSSEIFRLGMGGWNTGDAGKGRSYNYTGFSHNYVITTGLNNDIMISTTTDVVPSGSKIVSSIYSIYGA